MKRVVIMGIILLLTACSPPYDLEKATVTLDQNKISVLVADTNFERRKGLMDIPYISNTYGMWFIFEEEQQRSFWMKNTNFPLDAFFFDKNFILVDKLTMEPCLKDPCEVYSSKTLSKYVLEVNKDIYDFKEGDKAIFKP